MRKPTTAIAGKFGSRHFGTKPFLAQALRLTAKDKPLALYVGAASGDDREFGAALSQVIETAGAHKVLWPKLTGRKKDSSAVRDALKEIDLVFLGGGDVDAGMQVLNDADLIGDFRAAAQRGVVFAGMSAGAVMLGERWIRWPRDDARDDEAQTYECLSLVPCSLDTHGEDDDWGEARSFVEVRARELKKKVRVYGVPDGAALLVDADGTMTALAAPVPVFTALPNKKAKLADTLEAA